MITAASDILFLTVFHNLPGVSDGEQVDYYTSSDSESLRRDLASAADRHFTLFSENSEYEDYFSCAEYSIDDDSFDDAEINVFRSVLDVDEGQRSLKDLHPRDTFRGCRAVVADRINNADLSVKRRGIELFNFVMECALPTDDRRNPRCYIELETAKEFAPRFIDGLLDITRSAEESRWAYPRRYHIHEAFQPLHSLLEMLSRAVYEPAWPRNDLTLGKLLLLVDYYQDLGRAWSGDLEP
jgi:hypothetical protein